MRPARWKFSRGNLTMISVTHVIRGNAARQPPSGSAHEYPNTRMFLRFLAHGDFESGQCVCLPASVDNSCCRRHRRSGFGGVAFLVERRDSRSIIPTCWKINWAIFSRCHRLVAGERQTESESGRGREEICHRNGKRCQFSRFQPDSFRFRNPDRSCRNSRNATAGLEEGRGEGGRKEGRKEGRKGRKKMSGCGEKSTQPISHDFNCAEFKLYQFLQMANKDWPNWSVGLLNRRRFQIWSAVRESPPEEFLSLVRKNRQTERRTDGEIPLALNDRHHHHHHHHHRNIFGNAAGEPVAGK